MFDIVFYLVAAVTVAAALAVVLLRNVFRAALSLIVLFVAVAALYITLHADFLAVVQILVYVGAISILIIVALMLTHEMQQGSPAGKLRIPAIIVGVLLLGTLVFAVLNTNWQISAVAPLEKTTEAIGIKLFGEGGFLLPVEIAAIMLLSAVLGAIVMIREK
ncbi:MAG: NADH-quinone oxidoreductase subunit L [Chloroflexi bacterium]|nr:NADH-quinone oxidoreductase subunit L [Chloroflexota bacterium]MBM4452718.1 NADH-quinone oxidoreductase subunit L [Chloroflexota bacterium]